MRGLVDIGANLLDSAFQGVYRAKQCHPPDLAAVLKRANQSGVGKCILTAGSLEESKRAIEFVREQRRNGSPIDLYCTVGVHPTRSLEWLPELARRDVEDAMKAAAKADEEAGVAAAQLVASAEERAIAHPDFFSARDAHSAALSSLLKDGMTDGVVVAVGECGLDYDRLYFCPKRLQRVGFEAQLRLAAEEKLPLFLHSRAADDFAAICAENSNFIHESGGGVVHSFDGSVNDLRDLLELNLGLEIGINGCSLKSEENLAVVKEIPLSALHLETDAPWCSVKRTHAGFKYTRPLPFDVAKKASAWVEGTCVKDRCEPSHITQVLQILAAVRGESEEEICEASARNSERVFHLC